jgi:hypothetical protein
LVPLRGGLRLEKVGDQPGMQGRRREEGRQ